MFKLFGGRNKSQEFQALDPELLSPEGRELENGLLRRVVGQDRAIKKLVRVYQTFRSGLNAPGKPLSVLLFLGPTGSGKTRLVEAMAEHLFGHKTRMLKIDCAEFQNDHEIAKLIGSPPGYTGHDKTLPRITQEELDKYHRPQCKMSILLFDEIEKASTALYQLLLGMMEGKLTTGANKVVDLSHTIIILTSNIGSDEMQKIMGGQTGIGFTAAPVKAEDQDDELWKVAKDALKQKFSPEFVNRINKSIVFHALDDAALKQIVEIELEGIQDRILGSGYFVLLRVQDAAKDYIRKEGTDLIYGARELNRAVEKLLVEPASNLLATNQVSSRDMLVADYLGGDKLVFTKLEGVVDPPPPVEDE